MARSFWLVNHEQIGAFTEKLRQLAEEHGLALVETEVLEYRDTVASRGDYPRVTIKLIQK